jgi:alkylhydroperoxidase family enzyme
MERYTLVEYDAAGPGVRALYDDYMQSTGSPNVPIWVKSLGHSVDLLNAYWIRTKGSLLSGTLPLALKELVIFIVSVVNGSRYCTACHAHAVLRLDRSFTYDDLKTLTDPSNLLDLPPAYRGAVDFANRVANSANELDDADFERVARSGFSEAEIHELLGVIDLAVMFNCYTSAQRLPLDPEYRPMLP